MIGYHYNKEKQVIVAFFCDDVSRKFEGRKYWYRNICKSLWKVFDNGLIQYSDFLAIVKKDVDTIQVVTKVKVAEDCDKELAKEIAKNRLILKWARFEYRVVEEVLSNIVTQWDVVKYRASKKLKKTSEKIARLYVHHKAEN
jgi:hypothetical protein